MALILPMMLSAQGINRGNFDGQRGGMQHGNFEGYNEMSYRCLDLTDKQEEQIHDIRTDFKRSQIVKNADLKLAQIELHELMRDDIEGSKLDSAIDKVNKLKNELFEARIKNRVKIQKLLTDEQKDQLKKMHPGNRTSRQQRPREKRHNRR